MRIRGRVRVRGRVSGRGRGRGRVRVRVRVSVRMSEGKSRISRFLIDCKKSQLFLRKIFEIEHAVYCCGFNLKTFSKLQAVKTIEKFEMPSCREI